MQLLVLYYESSDHLFHIFHILVNIFSLLCVCFFYFLLHIFLGLLYYVLYALLFLSVSEGCSLCADPFDWFLLNSSKLHQLAGTQANLY